MKCKRWKVPINSRYWLFAAAFTMQSCGQNADPPTRSKSLSQGGDAGVNKGYLDPEDVVTTMLAPEKVATQTFTAEDEAMRRASLIPLGTKQTQQEPLLINSELALDAAPTEDVREQSDLRQFDTPIRNQGSRPWCTAFATIGTVENLGRRLFSTSLDLSEIHHFDSYGVYQTEPSFSAAKKIGLIDESLWPYYGSKQRGADSKIRAKLSSTKRIHAALSDVVAAIRNGEPVVINLDVNNSFMNPRAGGIVMPGGMLQGGHAIALTGVVLDSRVGGGGYFVIKNSWGSSWGDKGYGYLPFSYCNYSDCYAWSVGDIQVFDDSGKLRDKIPNVVPIPSPSPAPSPTPAPLPAPLPAPVPAPSADSLTADNVKLTSEIRDYRGLFGAYFYVLNVTGNDAAMNQIKSVVYQVEGYRNFKSVISDNGGTTTGSTTVSRSYKIWPNEEQKTHATIYLKNGKTLELADLAVSL